MSYYNPNGPYRSRNRIFFGVCSGLAEHFNFSVFWTRTLTVLAFIFTGFWPVGAVYLLLGLLMKTEPLRFASRDMGSGPKSAKSAGGLDERIRRMEEASKQYDWDERMQRG